MAVPRVFFFQYFRCLSFFDQIFFLYFCCWAHFCILRNRRPLPGGAVHFLSPPRSPLPGGGDAYKFPGFPESAPSWLNQGLALFFLCKPHCRLAALWVDPMHAWCSIRLRFTVRWGRRKKWAPVLYFVEYQLLERNWFAGETVPRVPNWILF